MRQFMEAISHVEFNEIVSMLDSKNQFDFESFCVAFKSKGEVKNDDVLDNVVDHLIFHMNINSDADLMNRVQNDFKIILGEINRVINESGCNNGKDE